MYQRGSDKRLDPLVLAVRRRESRQQKMTRILYRQSGCSGKQLGCAREQDVISVWVLSLNSLPYALTLVPP